MRAEWRPAAVLLAIVLVRCGGTESTPNSTSSPAPAPTPVPTSAPDAAAAAFADPVLAALKDVPPQIVDDFSDGRGWYGAVPGTESPDLVS